MSRHFPPKPGLILVYSILFKEGQFGSVDEIHGAIKENGDYCFCDEDSSCIGHDWCHFSQKERYEYTDYGWYLREEEVVNEQSN